MEGMGLGQRDLAGEVVVGVVTDEDGRKMENEEESLKYQGWDRK